MVHQGTIDIKLGRQIAENEVNRAIDEAEITLNKGTELLRRWETSPTLTQTMDPDDARKLIRSFRERTQNLLTPEEN